MFGRAGGKPKPLKEPISDVRIIELKAETYFGLVRLLRPGCRTIVLLTDQESKDKLLEIFKRSVWPYRKNKSLLFGYLCLDKNLIWYKTLLERVLGCEDLKVNQKNCIGTVLSLNGFNKYFRIYHAKHHEIDYYDSETGNDGFNEDDDRDDEDDDSDDDVDADVEQGEGAIVGGERCQGKNVVYTEDNLLDKLPIWLEKMFAGLTKRYFLDEWPEEIK